MDCFKGEIKLGPFMDVSAVKIYLQGVLDKIKDLPCLPMKSYWIDENGNVTEIQKTGHWKSREPLHFNFRRYECSICGYIQIEREDEIKKYLYCPNCGAKMEEQADE